MSLRLRIDADGCTGHGRCYTVNAPGWLEPDDEGYVTARGREIDVPASEEMRARDAARGCPEGAITIVDPG